jgi:hypothetical protein
MSAIDVRRQIREPEAAPDSRACLQRLCGSAATLVFAAPVPDIMAGSTNGPRNWYPTLMSPNEPSDEVTGRTGFLYYAEFLGDGTARHYMHRQRSR